MTDEQPKEDIDPGEPVHELSMLREEETSSGFMDRIRHGILRRVAGGHALEFALESLANFLREIGDLMFGWLGSSGSGRGDQ